MDAIDRRFDKLWGAVQAEIPGVRILNKDQSTFMRVVFGALTVLVKIFTLGKGKADWSGFTTTIWRTMYVPTGFFHWRDEDKYRLLRHELMHLRQFRRWPMAFIGVPFLWPINAVIMSFCYVLVLPAIWTFRAKFEREGYTQSMLSWYELHGFSSSYADRQADWLANTFGGSSYAWMWRRQPARVWALATMIEIRNRTITNDRDNVDSWT